MAQIWEESYLDFVTNRKGGSESGEDSSKDDWDEEEDDATGKEDDASQWGTAGSAKGEQVPKPFGVATLRVTIEHTRKIQCAALLSSGLNLVGYSYSYSYYYCRLLPSAPSISPYTIHRCPLNVLSTQTASAVLARRAASTPPFMLLHLLLGL